MIGMFPALSGALFVQRPREGVVRFMVWLACYSSLVVGETKKVEGYGFPLQTTRALVPSEESRPLLLDAVVETAQGTWEEALLDGLNPEELERRVVFEDSLGEEIILEIGSDARTDEEFREEASTPWEMYLFASRKSLLWQIWHEAAQGSYEGFVEVVEKMVGLGEEALAAA